MTRNISVVRRAVELGNKDIVEVGEVFGTFQPAFLYLIKTLVRRSLHVAQRQTEMLAFAALRCVPLFGKGKPRSWIP